MVVNSVHCGLVAGGEGWDVAGEGLALVDFEQEGERVQFHGGEDGVFVVGLVGE